MTFKVKCPHFIVNSPHFRVNSPTAFTLFCSQFPLTGNQSFVFTDSYSTGHTGFRCTFPNITHLWWWLKIRRHLIPNPIKMRRLILNQIPTMHFTEKQHFLPLTQGVIARSANIQWCSGTSPPVCKGKVS